MIVHGEAHPSIVEPSEVTAWQKGGQHLERQHKKAEAEIGLRAKRRAEELGMSPEEYLRAIGRGELDP
jgi:hypothetical protein